MDFSTRFQRASQAWLPPITGLLEQVCLRSTPGSSLQQMCDYHLGTGGKRLRALLPLLTAEALGKDPEPLLPFGAACEMLHNATLVHDDLQDGDDTRRGHPTVWSQFGVPQAINLGDAMFYYALLLLQRLDMEPSAIVQVSERLLRETLRVIDGQEREFSLKRKARPSLDDYFLMVEGKTSGLFSLPMAGAAQLCAAPQSTVDGLAEAARHKGVLFQIQDDVLDLYGSKGRQQRGSDIGEGKRSALVVHALAHATPAQAEALVALLDAPRASTTVQQVEDAAQLFRDCGSLTFALDELERRRAAATAVPAVAQDAGLRGLVEGMCRRFVQPITPILEQTRS